jgi:hypothetical protein
MNMGPLRFKGAQCQALHAVQQLGFGGHRHDGGVGQGGVLSQVCV